VIRDNKPIDMNPDLHGVVMDIVGFTEDALMAALSHLIDHKAQGTNFVGMLLAHRVLWPRTYLAKHYYDL
jgi:hypothetical protein